MLGKVESVPWAKEAWLTRVYLKAKLRCLVRRTH